MNYVTSLEKILWGITLVAVTIAIHGFGTLLTLLATHACKRVTGEAPSFLRGVEVLVLASWMIVLAHLVELLVWAGFLLWHGARSKNQRSLIAGLEAERRT